MAGQACTARVFYAKNYFDPFFKAWVLTLEKRTVPSWLETSLPMDKISDVGLPAQGVDLAWIPVERIALV